MQKRYFSRNFRTYFLKERIDERFEKAVDIIYQSTGKLIIVGIGKSAHVANKIVATLNSTGTPSQFLICGSDTRRFRCYPKNDVVLCISNSGNSPEIVYLLPFEGLFFRFNWDDWKSKI